MHELTKLIFDDMKPALGVTEPGAIAYATALARSRTSGTVKKVLLKLNSGMFKNAFTCGIPGSNELGIRHAAALGLFGADPEKELLCLDGITPAEEKQAEEAENKGMISVEMTGIDSRIFIEAEVTTDRGSASVIIRDKHTNVVRITENGITVYENGDTAADADSAGGKASCARDTENPYKNNSDIKSSDKEISGSEEPHLIHNYTLHELYSYAASVPADEISFIKKAFEMNLALSDAGLKSDKTTFSRYLLKKNGGNVISGDDRKTAVLLCGSAIEARVLGLSRPAMSITGSGAHGIIATLPLYAAFKVNSHTEEALLRAAALSFLICIYIKEYSGRLSAFCGCAIAAGTGAACGLAMLSGGDDKIAAHTINNMASGITGMVCDGGNHGCTVKGITAVDAAWQAAEAALNGVYVNGIHGINGQTPEETMRNMGLIASPGMTGTEKTIIDIMKSKS